jgi:hypothetical protein
VGAAAVSDGFRGWSGPDGFMVWGFLSCLIDWSVVLNRSLRLSAMASAEAHQEPLKRWAQPVSVIRPVAVSTWIGIGASGWFVGPAMTCACFAGSKAAPWQGQTR